LDEHLGFSELHRKALDREEKILRYRQPLLRLISEMVGAYSRGGDKGFSHYIETVKRSPMTRIAVLLNTSGSFSSGRALTVHWVT
jgi:hypothetical protein